MNKKVVGTGKTGDARSGIRIGEGENRSGGLIVCLQASRERDNLRFVEIVTRVRDTLCTRVGDGEVVRARSIGSQDRRP